MLLRCVLAVGVVGWVAWLPRRAEAGHRAALETLWELKRVHGDDVRAPSDVVYVRAGATQKK